MRRILLVAVLVLAMGSEAEAASYRPGAAMREWQRIAAARFPPPCESVLIETSTYQPEGLAAWTDQDTCTITLYPAFWSNRRGHRCSLIVHEYGHLAGLEHSIDPLNIMYPTAPATASRRCLRATGYI